MRWTRSQPTRDAALRMVEAMQADPVLAEVYRSNPGNFLPYTLYELQVPSSESLEEALAAFWTHILTDGREQTAGFSWSLLIFRLGSDDIRAWFAGEDRRRSAPVLFKLASDQMREEHALLAQTDGDDGDQVEIDFRAGYFTRLRQAAAVEPVATLLGDWRKERPVTIIGEGYDGWFPLDV
jgi:hypothetical protein